MKLEIHGEVYRIHWPRKPPEKVYLRYGLFAGTPSTNHATGEVECGLSVYQATLTADLTVRLHPSVAISPQLYGQGRLVFAVTGREVAVGSDGEPVLRGVRVLPYPIATDTPH